MAISTIVLENLFTDFSEFVSTKDKVPFSTFKTSKYFDDQEKYKEAIYKEARETIKNGQWKQEDIGTGKIHKTLIEAIKDKPRRDKDLRAVTTTCARVYPPQRWTSLRPSGCRHRHLPPAAFH